ncbi:hypothetical protein RQP46_006432 [Phenoliferia psychrophenolica]
MKEHDLDAYVVPTADAHGSGSEYVGECDKRREWLSGFTGSAGVAVVTPDKAYLFTDSRYYVQAAKQLDSNWELMKVGLSQVPTWDQFLATLPKDSRVGTDASLTSAGTAQALAASLAAKSVSLVYPATNLVDDVWTTRPARSASPILAHSLEFTGQPSSEKLANLRSFVKASATPDASYLLTALPNIAWILNLRGSDILFSPLFYAYLLVGEEETVLWVQDGTLSEDAATAMKELGVRVAPYEAVWSEIKGVKENYTQVARSPVDAAQAIKNSVELAGFRAAYLRDGAAWVRWAAWLEATVQSGVQISEWDAGDELTKFRSSGLHFAGLSYENISATGENAALPHYAPEKEGSSIIETTTPYLNDSGAQYLDGTIDTTRTVHFGKPTKEQKRAFTRVLQGHMAIDSLVFPEGTTGLQMDVLARQALWRDGMNYLHGSGHGVGEYLSVHEGPEGLGIAVPLIPGHVISNEPGYYEIGSFGIRIESVIGVKETATRRGFGDKKWFAFERFTTVPMMSAMVDFALLSPDEKVWLRKHNQRCRELLLPLVGDDKRAVKYLKRQ